MLIAGADTDVQGVRPGGLELLRDGDSLFDRVEADVLADHLVVLLDAVDQALHDKVLAAFLLDAADELLGKTSPALDRLRPVLIGAVVAVTG